MFRPHQNPHTYKHQDKPVPSEFSVLCWNIHKENTKPNFNPMLHSLLLSHPSDFLIFQEYKAPKHQPHELQKLSYVMAANIETKNHLYGLMTFSACRFEAKRVELTHQREFFISTHKSVLFTSHAFRDGELLHIINIHGINFVSQKTFNKELDTIESLLKTYSGAMIVCGDFNSWSKKRMKILEGFKQSLSLQKAVIQEEHHIKHIFSKPIDHIFYRGLKLKYAKAINTKKVSDHNPIYAIFEKL